MVEIAAALATASAPTIKRFVHSVTKPRYDEFIALYTQAFTDFLVTSRARCGSVKTILNKKVQIPLVDIYVNIELKFGINSPFEDRNLLEQARDGSYKVCVSGLAGSGKSMLMKWLGFSLIEEIENHQKIPLFIEIRDIEVFDAELEKTVFDYCRSPSSSCSLDQFKVGVREGIFILLLDGIDEIPPDKLAPFLKSLQRFGDRNNKCSIIASSRPGTQLECLRHFITYDVLPLDVDRVLAILDKAPYEPKRKELLQEALLGGLYARHRSFLSNPLLVMIVLITFDDAARIPENLSEFYSAAFDALFFKHDWSKGVFKREMVSGLEKPDFEKIFQVFCYLSYFKAEYSFSRQRLLDLIERGKASTNLEFSSENFLSDCMLSVCLLLIEEPKIIFVHRSFQEYFTARFVAGYSGPKLAELLDWISNRSLTDGTFMMVAQMNKEAVVRQWALPRAKKISREYNDLIQSGQYSVLLKRLGTAEIGCDLRSGSPMESLGTVTEDAVTLGLLSSICLENPQPGLAYIPEGNIYAGLEFGDLEFSDQTNIRELLSGKQYVQIRLSQVLSITALEKFGVNFLKSEVDELDKKIVRLEEYIKSRDEIAELIDIPTAGSE